MIRTFIHLRRLAAPTALAVGLGLTALAVSVPASATTPGPALPQTAPAVAGAGWLASQINGQGYIPLSTSPTTPDLASTANAVLALASAGADRAVATRALTYLEGQVSAYVTVSGSDGPGQLALLILDAHALGVSPATFGGTDLVSRLLATQVPSGPNAGLFGVQDPTYDGVYRQGLSLAALAAAGTSSGAAVTNAESWLTAQQCGDGGWTSYITAANPCNGKPGEYEGPDTNSTALAVEGLEAQHALGAGGAAAAVKFLTSAQETDGGWGYEPRTPHTAADPDSTALVMQALLALGKPPSAPKFSKRADPVTVLERFQITSGPGEGGFTYPGDTGPDLLATYQAVPALAGVTFAYDLGTPVVSGVAKSKGPTTGGTAVTVTGTGFTEAETVDFGSTPGTDLTVTSATSLTVVSPPAAAGTVDVRVTTPSGTSPIVPADHFTYRA
jgi:hypothetical protein